MAPLTTETLIIGCGIGGAAAALRLARDRERKILVLTRAPDATECNTRYAQGGIVSRGPEDSYERLVEDILRAGCNAGNRSAIEQLARLGPELVREILIDDLGMSFDRDPNGSYAFTSEGGHSSPRVLHVADATGKAIELALLERLKALPNVELRAGCTAIDLITSSHHLRYSSARFQPPQCLGAYVLDGKKQAVYPVLADATILATGGLGQIFRHTTNPRGARGDGLAMAHRAGARIVDAEYVQFHPTTLAVPGGDNFLITEAMRGEGGRLTTPDGRHFMDSYSADWGDLAPRDVVARAIVREMTNNQFPYVLLDISQQMEAQAIRDRFPTVYQRCLEFSIDITEQPIPVVPAAHYACGGVLVDECGRSSIQDLYAVGEVTCTGIHGANRLASTSLLEGLVWGTRAGDDIATRPKPRRPDLNDVPLWQEPTGTVPDPAIIEHDMRMIQDTMWLYAGLDRSESRLLRGIRALDFMWHDIEQYYRTCKVTDELVGLRNMLDTAWVVANAAWRNKRSLGTHYREGVPEAGPSLMENGTHSWPYGRSEF